MKQQIGYELTEAELLHVLRGVKRSGTKLRDYWDVGWDVGWDVDEALRILLERGCVTKTVGVITQGARYKITAKGMLIAAAQ